MCLEVWGQGWWGDSRGEGPSGSQEEGREEEVLGFLFEKCVVVGVIRRVRQFDKVYGTSRLKGGKGGGVKCRKEGGERVESGKVEALDDQHVRTEA